jgi:uncharacterized protein DUF3606
MSNDRLNPGEPDRSRISLDEEYELRYWTTILGVSKEALNSAINAVGNESYKVRQYLAKQRDYAHHY